MQTNGQAPITEHLANEQTFLAWLRTGVEVMAFGFVAIKFSLFASQVMGIVLVGVGTLMTLLAYLRYRKTVNQLRNGQHQYSTLLVTVTVIVMFVISVILLYCIIDASTSKPTGQVAKQETFGGKRQNTFFSEE